MSRVFCIVFLLLIDYLYMNKLWIIASMILLTWCSVVSPFDKKDSIIEKITSWALRSWETKSWIIVQSSIPQDIITLINQDQSIEKFIYNVNNLDEYLKADKDSGCLRNVGVCNVYQITGANDAKIRSLIDALTANNVSSAASIINSTDWNDKLMPRNAWYNFGAVPYGSWLLWMQMDWHIGSVYFYYILIDWPTFVQYTSTFEMMYVENSSDDSTDTYGIRKLNDSDPFTTFRISKECSGSNDLTDCVGNPRLEYLKWNVQNPILDVIKNQFLRQVQ